MHEYVLKLILAATKEFIGAASILVSSLVPGGRYSILSNGELHIRNVSFEDAKEPYRCLARHRLTGEKTLSSVAGR